MCSHVRPVSTRTKFVILMHPKEFKKIKNGTGHLTHLSLKNSELHIDVDFSGHRRINELIDDPSSECYLLYPSKKSILLNANSIVHEPKRTVIFILDATWDISKSMLRKSTNLQRLPHISFEHTKTSQFAIKTQPAAYCLSTIESTLCVLELLEASGDESIGEEGLAAFLDPFKKMIKYQQSFLNDPSSDSPSTVRFKRREPMSS